MHKHKSIEFNCKYVWNQIIDEEFHCNMCNIKKQINCGNPKTCFNFFQLVHLEFVFAGHLPAWSTLIYFQRSFFCFCFVLGFSGKQTIESPHPPHNNNNNWNTLMATNWFFYFFCKYVLNKVIDGEFHCNMCKTKKTRIWYSPPHLQDKNNDNNNNWQS